MMSLTGFPDVEGIETRDKSPAIAIHGGLTGFPDVEGIETSSRRSAQDRRGSDRLP